MNANRQAHRVIYEWAYSYCMFFFVFNGGVIVKRNASAEAGTAGSWRAALTLAYLNDAFGERLIIRNVIDLEVLSAAESYFFDVCWKKFKLVFC